MGEQDMRNAEFSAANTLIILVVGGLLLSMIVQAFYIVPQQQGGFWQAYSYNPNLDMSSYDISKNMSEVAFNAACDITQDAGCTNTTPKKSIIEKGKSVIETMVGGAYGSLLSIYNGYGVTKVLFEGIGNVLGVDSIIITTISTILLFVIVFAILLLIFNRS
jgi:hypothetical protein